MKGPTSNNKSSLKEGNTYPATINIYPGINPTTKIANECSSLTFVSVFPRLQQWLTSQNLEQFIRDQNGDNGMPGCDQIVRNRKVNITV
jgi:hypothetical protein